MNTRPGVFETKMEKDGEGAKMARKIMAPGFAKLRGKLAGKVSDPGRGGDWAQEVRQSQVPENVPRGEETRKEMKKVLAKVPSMPKSYVTMGEKPKGENFKSHASHKARGKGKKY